MKDHDLWTCRTINNKKNTVIYSCIVATAVELLIPVNYTEWIINYSHTALHYNGTMRPFIIEQASQWRKPSNSYSTVAMDTVINHSHVPISVTFFTKQKQMIATWSEMVNQIYFNADP